MNELPDSEACQLDQFESYLYVLARAHLGPHAAERIEASDLVQQTLLDAHVKQDQFRGETKAQRAAWLRQILARNLADAIRRQRRAKRDVSRQQQLEASINESFRHAEDWLAANQPSPSEHVAKKEELLQLADALTKVPAAQREAVILRHLQGLPLAEVAKRLERSEPAVAGLVYRGLNNLHTILEEREHS